MINTEKFNQIVEKAKAANDPKWIRAIERAAREILSGEMIVTLFADNTALVTTPNGQEFARVRPPRTVTLNAPTALASA